MARGVIAAAGVLAALCLLLSALPLHGEAARLSRGLAELEEPTARSGARYLQADESRAAQLRFEAGDPECGSFRFHYRCFNDTPSGYTPAVSTPKTTTTELTSEYDLIDPSETVAKKRAVDGDRSCGFYQNRWRCFDIPSRLRNSPVEPASIFQQLAGESDVAKLRFKAGDPACGRFRFHYRCFDDPPSAATITSTSQPASQQQQQLTEIAESRVAQLRFQAGDTSCGRFGYRYKCLRTGPTPSQRSLAAASVAPVLVDSSAQAFVAGGDPYDCGPLGKHKYRCGDRPGLFHR